MPDQFKIACYGFARLLCIEGVTALLVVMPARCDLVNNLRLLPPESASSDKLSVSSYPQCSLENHWVRLSSNID